MPVSLEDVATEFSVASSISHPSSNSPPMNMPKLINAFSLLNVQEHELKAWTVHQARALGLDTIASNHPHELLEATRITYAHLRALREDFLLDGADESPEWQL